MSLSCLADVGAVLGEGPAWVAREAALYWVDIEQGLVFRWSQEDGLRTLTPPTTLCSLAPRRGGGFVGGGLDGLYAVDLAEGCAMERIAQPEPEFPGNRFNDGKTDRAGRFWAGTMDRREREASGSLYRLDPGFEWTRIDSGYRVTNGPAFSPDGRILYHSDSALQRVYAFDLASDGKVGERRLFAQFGEGEGYPDGMTVDAEGCLWIAFWDGWCLRRLSPGGERLSELAVPVQKPTSCAFGGPDYRQLFITSARRGLDAAALALQPQAGGLFVAEPGVAGIAETMFAG